MPAGAATGDLSPLAGTAACFEHSPAAEADGCSIQHGVTSPEALAASPEGASVYLAGHASLGIFQRDTATGVLTQPIGAAGCANASGADSCQAVAGIQSDGFDDVAVSPPDASHPTLSNVYYAMNGGIVVFSRDTSTGALTRLEGTAGCITPTGSGGACTPAHVDGASLAQWLYASPDGRNVYAGSTSTSYLSIFRRDPATGALTQATDEMGCVSGAGDPLCADSTAAASTAGLVLSPDGRFAYVSSPHDDTVDVFSRDTATGGLIEVAGACLVDASNPGEPACSGVRALRGVGRLAISPNGAQVHIANASPDLGGGVATLNRSTSTGLLTQPGGAAGCITGTGHDGVVPEGTCATGHGLGHQASSADSVALAADGATLYLAGSADADIAVIDRDTSSGTLSQDGGTAGCEAPAGNAANCAAVTGIDGLDGVTVAPDGRHVYGSTGDGLVAFGRTAPAGPRYSVWAVVSPTAGGSVAAASASAGATCSGQTCSVNSGTSVTLTATAAAGYAFAGWSGACSGLAAGCVVSNVTGNRTATATFSPTPVKRTVSWEAQGGGAVTGAIISGSGTCDESSCTVDSGATVQLTATPDAEHVFDRWSGACAEQARVCSLTGVTTDVHAVARFTEKPPPPPGSPTIVNPLKFTPPPSTAIDLRYHDVMSRAAGQARVGLACEGVRCGGLNTFSIDDCVQAIGGNPDLAITGSCLKMAKKVNPLGPGPGPQLPSKPRGRIAAAAEPLSTHSYTFTSTGPVSANGVTFTPAAGETLRIIETTGDNAAEEFSITGVTHDVSFESVTLDSGNTGWRFSQQAGGGFGSAYNHGHGFSSTSAPVPGSSDFNGLAVASATVPSFRSGGATTAITLKLPADLGGGTGSQPLVLKNGTLAGAIAAAANTPLIATGANAEEQASNCAQAFTEPVPSGPGAVTIPIQSFSYHGIHIEAPPGVQGGLTIAGPSHYVAKLRASLPFPADDATSMASILEIYQGKLRFGCAEGHFNPPVGLSHGDIGLEDLALGFVSGNGSTDFLGSIATNALGGLVHTRGHVGLSIPSPGSGNPWTLHIDGNLDLESLVNLKGKFDISSVGYLRASGRVDSTDMGAGVTMGPFDVGGTIDSRGQMLFETDGHVQWLKHDLLSADVILSNIGFGACGTAGVPVGFTATWKGDFDFFALSCDDLSKVRAAVQATCQELRRIVANPVLAAFQPQAQVALDAGDCADIPGSRKPAAGGTALRPASTAPGGVLHTTVKKGTKQVAFVFTGTDAPPLVTLTGPHGRQVHTSELDTGDPRSRAVLDPARRTTTIGVYGPAAGTWFAQVDTGSSPVASFGVAAPLPPVTVKATVSGKGQSRTMRYTLAGAAGRAVNLFEKAGAVTQRIGTASHSVGTLRFSPLDGPAGRRQIVAVVTRAGQPLRRTVVGSYVYSGSIKLAAPRGLKIRGAGDGAALTFRPVAGAGIYTASVTVSDGRKFKILTKRRTLKIPRLGPGTSVISAQVYAIDAKGRPGAIGRVRATVHRAAPRTKVPGK